MSNQFYDLEWGNGVAARISPQIRSEIGRIRRNPPLIPIVPGMSQYEDVVQNYRVDAGPPLKIKPSRTLAPIRISSEFALAQQQFADDVLATRLALRPASDLAFAEDAIILHGSRAVEPLKKMNITDEDGTLAEQEGLFREAPKPIGKDKSIMDSIREGLEQLQRNQQHGPYCVVVSPDLHREAISPIGTSTTPRIAPILPELRESGFRWSEAAPVRTGVIFSLGGSAVDMPIPWDTHVECRKVEGDATFVVVQQFRLRINDPRAVLTLA
jgi:uncharacterized linocin/CFP29 family protein